MSRCPLSAELLPNFVDPHDGGRRQALDTGAMFLNGAPASAEDVKALGLANYGHFTSIRVDDHRVRGLDLHVSRLVRDSRLLFDHDLDAERVRQLVRQAVGENTGSVVIRVTIFDPSLELGQPGVKARPQILVTARSAVDQPPPPIRLKTATYEREVPLVKHTGLFGTIYHRRRAQLEGFDDVLFTDGAGAVSEGATWNIGFIERGVIVWPDLPCLPGVTKELLDRVHPGITRDLDLGAIRGMNGAFITNAAIGVRPVKSIDGTVWGEPDPLLEQIAKEYQAIPGDLV